MKISTQLSYSGGFKQAARQVVEMEAAGLDLVWVAEAYGFDSPSLMGYLAALTERVEIGSAILPIYTRTPTLIAMTAAGIDALSDGRFHLGLGASGPQVIEGFHGVPYTAPLGRTREIIEICRDVWRREAPLEHHGRYYDLPLPSGEGTGLGKALKIIAHPVRPSIPVWVASLGERNVAMTAEVADGWIPILFIPERARERLGRGARRGRREARRVARRAAGHRRRAPRDRRRRGGHRDPRARRPRVALYVGGHGRQGQELLQRARLPLRLRAARQPRSRTCTSRARRRRPRRSSPTSSWS